MSWYPRACPACLGDLYDDVMEARHVTCMMCARSFVAADVLSVRRAVTQSAERPERASAAERLAS